MNRILNIETTKYINKKVKACGWVSTRRDHGKIIFVDLRDISGLVQVIFPSQLAQSLRPEWVICVEGMVKERPKGMINPKMETGKIEIEAKNLEILSKARALPFSIANTGYEISEEKRLKYRYLDLRRERMKKNLKIRQKVIQFIRDFLQKEGFLEIETPILTKSTPEGARDFLVPSRIYPGKFYALPQSPQQYKQLLMVAGIEKYFQMARAFRDEDPRADRQPEHTQLDIEMSFAEQKDVLNLTEKLYVNLIKKLFPEKKIQKIPFPRISYQEAIKKYKTDKPDLRKNQKNPNELAFCFITDFPMFEWHPADPLTGSGYWGAQHHPFTRPQTENIAEIKKHPKKVSAFQYDFVLNGAEIGGGSLRTTNLDVLTAVFEVLGHKKEEVKKQFYYYFEAFSYGVPPHGGIASGVDRFLTMILGEPNIREVIAFPKTGDSRDLMMDVPAEVTPNQLKELHLKITKLKKRK